jgi:probable HAF family extracellular repeat protein
MTLLEGPFGPRTSARDINDQGQIVGWMGSGTGTNSHAFLFADGAFLDLGVVPGGMTGFANALNEIGDVAGVGVLLAIVIGVSYKFYSDSQREKAEAQAMAFEAQKKAADLEKQMKESTEKLASLQGKLSTAKSDAERKQIEDDIRAEEGRRDRIKRTVSRPTGKGGREPSGAGDKPAVEKKKKDIKINEGVLPDL